MDKYGKLLVCTAVSVLFVVLMAPWGNYGNMANAAGNEIKWKCQLYWPMSSPSYPHAINLIKKINDRTQGKLKIETYPSGNLVPNSEIFNATKRGMIQFASISPSYCLDQAPLGYLASGLPFNLAEAWEGLYFFKTLGFEKMMREEYAKHGLYYVTEKVLAGTVSTSTPVRKIDDFKGLKIRSTGAFFKYLASIGAAPANIPAGDIYSALNSKVVDGVNYAGAQSIITMKFYETVKYYLNVPLYIDASSYIVNQKALEKLPREMQKILLETLEEEIWTRTVDYEYEENVAVNELKNKYGLEIIDIPREEYIRMQKLAIPIWDEIAKKSPECAKAIDMLKKYNKSLGRM